MAAFLFLLFGFCNFTFLCILSISLQRVGYSFYGRGIFGRRHSQGGLKLSGKVWKRTVGKVVCNFRKIHSAFADDVFGALNLHLIKVINDSAVFFRVEQRLQGGTADGEFAADIRKFELLADMGFHKLDDFLQAALLGGLLLRRVLRSCERGGRIFLMVPYAGDQK